VAYQYEDYPSKANRVADAANSLLDAIGDPGIDSSLVIDELEAATSTVTAQDLRARFEPATPAPAAALQSAEDVLSQILLELQSANALMAAGVAMNEHGGGGETKYLTDAVAQIQSTSTDISAHMRASRQRGFAPQGEPSATPEAALALFQKSAGRTLDSIAGGTEGIISSAQPQLNLRTDDPGDADSTDPDGAGMRLLISRFWKTLESETSAKFGEAIWNESEPWVSDLLDDKADQINVPAGVELRHVLNAAWLARSDPKRDPKKNLNAAVAILQSKVSERQEKRGT